LGCNSLLGCPRSPGAGRHLLCLRVSPRSDRTWEIDLRPGERGLAQRTSGPACAQTCNLLPPGISRTAERCSYLTVCEPIYERGIERSINESTINAQIDALTIYER